MVLSLLDHQVTRLIRHLLDLQRDRVRRQTARVTQVADVVIVVDVLLRLSLEDRRWNDNRRFQ